MTDHRGNTPLHVAAAAPGTEVVDFLLKRGAKTDVRNQDEQTPLHRAIDEWWGEASEVIKLLIRAGADPESVDVKGETPLQYAQKRNKHHLVIKLRQFGAKV